MFSDRENFYWYREISKILEEEGDPGEDEAGQEASQRQRETFESAKKQISGGHPAAEKPSCVNEVRQRRSQEAEKSGAQDPAESFRF
ncbi:hypothetical protein L596_003464 [Steinernema carpocapsae]|uniref:Uncharacterized protein n=1 Tax=Steinernema carpocapsae TaxID=34508 RepID=A0A4U8UU91_STECR|nr:hypothetical protein L596_003464 [Steinernema carpocapsae]